MRVASAYQEYRPGKPLEEYADSDRIPLLQMHHLLSSVGFSYQQENFSGTDGR